MFARRRPEAASGARALAELERCFASAPSRPDGSLYARLLEQDAQLVAAGFPALSPWWREQFSRFYEIGRRTMVLRVGRRGGKSSSLSRLAVCEVLHGRHDVPPGDIGMFALISVRRTEAQDRLRMLRTVLDALGVEYVPRGDDIELPGLGRMFRVFTASLAGVRGPTCIGALCDEVAWWRDDKTGSNPATEVLASLRPTLLTQPRAKLLLSSSPLGELDAHAQAYGDGDTHAQLTAHAPTWIANPSITEKATHEEEPNEAKWQREYAAIPMQGTEESLFPAVLCERAMRSMPGDIPPEAGVTYCAAMDPGLVRNAWTLAVAARRMVHGRIKRSVVAVREWRGSHSRPLRPDLVLTQIAPICRAYGIETLHTDEFHGQSLQIIAERPEIDLHLAIWPTSHGGKIERYERTLAELSDDALELPRDPQVKADLLAVKRVLTPNGWTIRLPESPDGRHCDHASSITLALEHCLDDPQGQAVLPSAGTPAYYASEQQRVIEHLEQQWEKRRREEEYGT